MIQVRTGKAPAATSAGSRTSSGAEKNMHATANAAIATRITGSRGDVTDPAGCVSTYTKHQKAQLADTASFARNSTTSAIWTGAGSRTGGKKSHKTARGRSAPRETAPPGSCRRPGEAQGAGGATDESAHRRDHLDAHHVPREQLHRLEPRVAEGFAADHEHAVRVRVHQHHHEGEEPPEALDDLGHEPAHAVGVGNAVSRGRPDLVGKGWVNCDELSSSERTTAASVAPPPPGTCAPGAAAGTGCSAPTP